MNTITPDAVNYFMRGSLLEKEMFTYSDEFFPTVKESLWVYVWMERIFDMN